MNGPSFGSEDGRVRLRRTGLYSAGLGMIGRLTKPPLPVKIGEGASSPFGDDPSRGKHADHARVGDARRRTCPPSRTRHDPTWPMSCMTLTPDRMNGPDMSMTPEMTALKCPSFEVLMP